MYMGILDMTTSLMLRRMLTAAFLLFLPAACQTTQSVSDAVSQPATAAVSAIAESIVGRSFKGMMRSHGYTLATTVEFLNNSEYRASDQWESWRGTWRTEGDRICLNSTYNKGCYPASMSTDGNSLYLPGSKFISGLQATS